MKNNEPITSKHSADQNSRIEEEDLWDIDDWDNNSEEPAVAEAQKRPAPSVEQGDLPGNDLKNEESTEASTTAEEDVKATPAPSRHTGSISKEAKVADKLINVESESSAGGIEHQSSSDQEDLRADDSPAKKLSVLEITALGVFATLMIGAAIYSYMGLNKINPSEDTLSLSLPVAGDNVTVTEFNTFWLSAEDYPDSKIGVTVMPAASITLDSAASQSGALRVYFRNNDNEIVGDTITLIFANGKFIDNQEAHTQIQDGGATAQVISSDGLYEEGDYRAYMLDPNLVWQVHVTEGASEIAAGDSFKEIIHTKVSSKRQ